MAEFKISGIISRTADYKDYDRMITILSPDGRFDLNLKGCRKQKAKLKSAGQLFAFGDFILLERNKHFIMISAEIKDSFFDLAKDYTCFYNASKLCVLMNDFYNYSADSSNELFSLFLRTLSRIAYDKSISSDYLLIKAAASALLIAGIYPNFTTCAVCGKKINESMFLSAREGGLVCFSCRNNNKYLDLLDLNFNTCSLLKKLPFEDSFSEGISSDAISDVKNILEKYLSEHLEKYYQL